MITADMNFVGVKSIMIYQIIHPAKFLCNVVDGDKAIQILCQAILRDVVGYNSFQFLRTNKRELAFQMEVIANIIIIIKENLDA